jgi:precorrin-2 dehydrogenase/sirohydrochlorin ferrochelatase
MGYYAAFLDVGGRRCLVTGGGKPAADKADGLLAAGATVSVVWDQIGPELEALAGRVQLLRRRPVEADLKGVFVAIEASGDDAVGPQMKEWSRRHGAVLNVLDRPALCDFIAPALVRREPLQVAISTAGRSPFMASLIRKRLERELGPEWGELVELVGRLRDHLRAEGVPLAKQQEIYEGLDVDSAVTLLAAGRHEEAARLLGV